MESGKIIVVANQKGGVAKTSTVRNLSYALAEMGKKVLVTTPSPRISESILSPFVTLPNKIFSLFMRKNWNGSSRPPLNITTL